MDDSSQVSFAQAVLRGTHMLLRGPVVTRWDSMNLFILDFLFLIFFIHISGITNVQQSPSLRLCFQG